MTIAAIAMIYDLFVRAGLGNVILKHCEEFMGCFSLIIQQNSNVSSPNLTYIRRVQALAKSSVSVCVACALDGVQVLLQNSWLLLSEMFRARA